MGVRSFMAGDFVAYAAYVHGLRAAPFQVRWARAMSDASEGRLVVVAPPESGKTAWCMAFCCWLIGRDPQVHLGYVGNTAAQALRQSVAVRDTIRWNGRFAEIFPGVRLDAAKGTAEREWFVGRDDPGDKDATFLATGFRGPLLGARLDVVVLDDYSDQENTGSPEQQERAWDWLQQNVLTRLNPDRGRLICVQTRWADGDVVGRFASAGATLLEFAALSDAGVPLWPERWQAEGLARRRAEMGARNFDLHYMGLVLSRDGSVFKPGWWSWWDAPGAFPTGGRVALSLDTASKTGLSNDYSAATVWTSWEHGYYVLHAWRGRLEFPDLLRQVLGLLEEWRPLTVLIEDAGSGVALIQELRRRGVPVQGVRPRADKVTRAIGVTATVEAGRVFLPRFSGWLADFRYELEVFPGGRHDDWVDSVVQYLEWVEVEGSGGMGIWF